MGTIGVQFDFAEFGRRSSVGAKRGAAAKKWMAAQSTNVVMEARDGSTSSARLDELARNGDAKVRIAVAGNKSTDPATLIFLSGVDLITSEISQRLTRNPASPFEALHNVSQSFFARWFGNWQRIKAHPNWTGSMEE